MRAFLKGAIAALGLAALVAAAPAEAQDKLKVGFVYVGPVGDFGWTYQHELGRRAMQEALGDKVESTYVENVPEGPDAERVIEGLVRSGHQLIFTTSFGFMEATVKVAQRNPEVKFEHATGYKRLPNLATYAGRFYQGRYISGKIAARMSKTGIVGYIGSFPIPEVVSGINAFMLGAQSERPDMKVKIVWVNSWFDPGKEGDAAKALLDQGADIIAQHTDSPAAMQVAAERGALAFGQDSDMIKFGPNTQLTSIINDWSGYYIDRVNAVLNGTWESTDVWGGLDTGILKMAPYTNMPDDVKALAEETEKAIHDGTYKVFTGPITKQDGSLAVKEGEVLPDPAILGMNWYIQGIDEKAPN
jgi:simple sugar transport system substrate-binding protein